MKTILVIEDNAGVRLPLVDALQLESYRVLEAVNGEEGVTLAEEEKPDLIVCDIMLPKLDGFGVLAALRKHVETSVIPFIFLTAMDSVNQLKEGYRLGADDYITKPYDREMLLDRIRLRLDKADRYWSSLNKVRSKLIGMAPHEFNTPLNGILGFAALLKDHASSLGPSEVSDYAGLIYESGSRLLKTVMNYIRYLELQVLLSRRDYANKYAGSRLQDPRELAERRIRSLAVDYPEREDDVVLLCEACPLAIREIDFQYLMDALLDNALKFSRSGERVTISSVISDGRYLLSIADEGCGISEENLSCLEAFTQMNRELNEQQGLGLGLAIVKGLCRLYGASFVMSSQLGKGSVVTIGFLMA